MEKLMESFSDFEISEKIQEIVDDYSSDKKLSDYANLYKVALSKNNPKNFLERQLVGLKKQSNTPKRVIKDLEMLLEL